MKTALFCVVLVFTSLEDVTGLQENCRMDAASRNSPLAGTFKSRKEGAIYTCRCDSSSDCSDYYCSKDTEDEGEDLVGEPVGESGSSLHNGQTVKITVIEPTSETVGIPTTAAPTDCRDSDTGIIYDFGQKFTKVGTDGQQTCTCNNDGTISCKGPLKTCPLPRSPEPEYDPAFVPPKYGCYDPWDKKWYRNYQSWDRQRLMNVAENEEDEEIFGTYRCSCSMGVTQCSARNIPCCDRSTGRFVEGGGRFLTSMSGTNYICTCRMQRGRFSDCLPERLATKSAGSTPTQGSKGQRSENPIAMAHNYSYRPVTQVQCRDRYRQGALYSDGQTWIQWRTRGGAGREGWTCTCIVQGSRARTKCRYGIDQN